MAMRLVRQYAQPSCRMQDECSFFCRSFSFFHEKEAQDEYDGHYSFLWLAKQDAANQVNTAELLKTWAYLIRLLCPKFCEVFPPQAYFYSLEYE